MPNLELYKIFLEVANEKNITRASEKLNISQPAVTRHIKNLESQLNLVLFNRTKRNGINKSWSKVIFRNLKTCLSDCGYRQKIL